MAFHITHRSGAMISNPPLSAFGALLNEPKEPPEDEEHVSVSVTHESEWRPVAYGGGSVVRENLDDDLPRHMHGVADEKLLRLWEAPARSEIDVLALEPWLPGC